MKHYTSLTMPSMAEINKKKKEFTAVSFFAGCGGSSTGHKLAGFNVLYANEFVEEAQTTYKANHPKTIVDGRDIRTVTPQSVLKMIGLKKGELDLMDGSPPCHTAGTLVFTKRGYVEIQDVVEGDYVLTHNNRWRKVTGTTRRSYTGKLVTLTTMNAEPVEATPKHGFFVLRKGKKQWVSVHELTTDDYVKVPRDSHGDAELPGYSGVSIGVGFNRFTGEFNKTVQVSELQQFFDREEFWWVVGRFLGDGWVHERRKKSAKHSARRPSGLPIRAVFICGNKNNSEYAEITSVLDSLGWKYKVQNRRTVFRIKLQGTKAYGASTELANFFQQFGKYCHGKYLPQFVYDLPAQLKAALLKGYISADGRESITKYGSDTIGFSSVSRHLCYGMVRIMNDALGICAGRIKCKDITDWSIEGRTGKTLPSYGTRATSAGVGDSLAYKMHKGDLWVRVRSLSIRPFSGDVYNLHVEQDESYTANGLASHNCSSFSNAGKKEEGWGKEKDYSDGKVQRTDDLFFEYVRLLKGIKPKVFTAENVEGLVQGTAKGYFLEILQALKDAGYVVSARVLNSAYLGVPQARRRLIFVGVRKDLCIEPQHPKPRANYLTVREVLPHIEYIKSQERGILTYVPSDVPSPTLTASDGVTGETASFSCGGFCETRKGDRRKYKISELKKLFSFPDDFKLTGTFEQQWERLGRSVPPLMMYAVSCTIRENILEPYHDWKAT